MRLINGDLAIEQIKYADYGKTWLAYRRKPEEYAA